MTSTGADILVIGVDGLDYDLVHQIRHRVPTLYELVRNGGPHASVFPPDSVPSWTTIVTGLPPETHGQLTNVKFFLETTEESSVSADLNSFSNECFWEHCQGDDVAVINPFLAYPPWAPKGQGAMVSGPPFAEEPPEVADPRGLLVGEPPSRMGGFSKIPHPSELDEFCAETLAIGRDQYEYAIRQLESRRWDLLFFTTLVIDRVEHYTWRNYARNKGAAADVIPQAHVDLDAFLQRVVEIQAPHQRIVLLSDHGHGPRAHIGVNLQEYLRRKGHFSVDPSTSSLKRRAVEWSKTAVYSTASRVNMENLAIRLARKLPAKRAMKSGTFAGKPGHESVSVPDLAGSNPFGGIEVPSSKDTHTLIADLIQLRHKGQQVFKWVAPAADILAEGESSELYPTLLFEMYPQFGPTWNMYGPLFAPVITRKRQSGGHTRRGVYAERPPLSTPPVDSSGIARRLRELMVRSSVPGGQKQ